MKKLLIAAAVVALSACNQSADANQALADANASGNAASEAVENAVRQSDATPLQKEQALALMKQRHENYEQIGKANRAVRKALESSSPDLATVRQSAARIEQLSSQAPTWFPAGTGPDVGKTEAKADIWQQPQQFAAGMKDFQAAAAAFNRAAQGNDVAAIKAAHADLGKTCKSCHERFRHED
jgi:cytochrome c556